jgi:hypothetical protein
VDDLSGARPAAAAVVGSLYGFLRATSERTFLGATLAGWLRFLTLLLAPVGLLLGWPLPAVLAAVALTLALRLLYARARRDGFVRFMAVPAAGPAGASPLADDERVRLFATGRFSVVEREEYVIQRPADYWRAPIGDHAVMVEHAPGRFLYQFIQSGALDEVRAGYLLFGRRPLKALAISFVSTWDPQREDRSLTLVGPGPGRQSRQQVRRIYLSFHSEAERQAVWANLLRDAHPSEDQSS